MAGPSNAPGPGEPEITRLFHEPAFRELAERGSPAFVASVPDGVIAWANEAAHRLLGANLAGIPARLGPGASGAPRLKRLLVESGGGVVPLTFLTKRGSLAGERGEVLVAAMLGAPPVTNTAPEPQAEPAPAGQATEAQAETPAEAGDAASSDAEPATAAALLSATEVRAKLLNRHRNPTVRFLWQTDEAGRVASVAPPLAEIVGAENADIVGRELAAIVEGLELDASGRLLSAMQVPETW